MQITRALAVCSQDIGCAFPRTFETKPAALASLLIGPAFEARPHSALRGAENDRRIARMHKIGGIVYPLVECRDAGGERPLAVSLRVRSGYPAARGERTAAGELRRCP